MARAKKPGWRNSKEKEILYNDIDKGHVAGMTPNQVYATHGGIYHKFKYENFRGNLHRLRKNVADQKLKATTTKQAYDHDKKYYKKPPNIFVWRGSEAQKQLWVDIEDGTIDDDVSPMDARLSRTMYGELPLEAKEWRNYLWQERRRHFNNLDPEEKKKIIEMKNKKLFM